MIGEQLSALADLTIPALVVGFIKSPAAPVLGLASIVLGVSEAETSWLAPVVGIGGGGVLLILAWFANAVKNVMQRWLETQGQKLIDLPTAAALIDDKRSLTVKLVEFAEAAEAERIEMQKFRVDLARTLENHSVRLTGLESRRSTDRGHRE